MCTLGRFTLTIGVQHGGETINLTRAGAIKISGKATQSGTLKVPMAWREQIPAGMTVSVKGVQNVAWLSSAQPAKRLWPYAYPPRQEPFSNASPDPNRCGMCPYSLAKSAPTRDLNRLCLIHDDCLCLSHMGQQLPMGLLPPWPGNQVPPGSLSNNSAPCCGEHGLLSLVQTVMGNSTFVSSHKNRPWKKKKSVQEGNSSL